MHHYSSSFRQEGPYPGGYFPPGAGQQQPPPPGSSQFLYGTLPRASQTTDDMSRSMFSHAPSRSSVDLGRPRPASAAAAADPGARVPAPQQINFDTMPIPEMDKLTDEEVAAMLADEDKLERFIVSLSPPINNKEAAERCKKLADDVEAASARVAELRAAVETKREDAQTARFRLEEARTKRREIDGMFSLQNVIMALHESENAADTASYDLIQKLRREEITPEQFAREFLAARTEYHTLRLKAKALDPTAME